MVDTRSKTTKSGVKPTLPNEDSRRKRGATKTQSVANKRQEEANSLQNKEGEPAAVHPTRDGDKQQVRRHLPSVVTTEGNSTVPS